MKSWSYFYNVFMLVEKGKQSLKEIVLLNLVESCNIWEIIFKFSQSS